MFILCFKKYMQIRLLATETVIAGGTPGRTKTAGTAIFARTSFIDDDLSAAEFAAVQTVNRFLGRVVVIDFNKTKTFGSTGFTVIDDPGRCDFSECFESISEVTFIDTIGNVSHIDVHREYLSSLKLTFSDGMGIPEQRISSRFSL
ncbi:MAG: hypothetical protein PHQ27_03730 [Victivallales bacterium]|nr:hypothetical protein [Victivallales bacterium]